MTDSDIRTYRATTIHQGPQMVEEELGREAVILHTRQIEQRVAAVAERPGGSGSHRRHRLDRRQPILRRVSPSDHAIRPGTRRTGNRRLPAHLFGWPFNGCVCPRARAPGSFVHPNPRGTDDRTDRSFGSPRTRVFAQLDRDDSDEKPAIPAELFDLYTELIDSELDESLSRELVVSLKRETLPEELSDPSLCRARLVKMVENEFHAGSSITSTPGQRRVVALVGPTGVGKTTTIAKLAANLKLRTAFAWDWSQSTPTESLRSSS
ncbi:MAG: hypothetical protein CM1200mP2_02320 [Planctomycetaceae bacterium]|nr:MAG: hypothetical protein CM1200mP2_02320 [Planctomycetaceae bacterium]